MDELVGFLMEAGIHVALAWNQVPASAGGGHLYASWDLDEAITGTSRLIVENPANVRPRFLRGVAFRAQHRYSEALADLDVVLEHEPGHARAWLIRSEIHFLLGDRVSGEADRARALALDPALQ